MGDQNIVSLKRDVVEIKLDIEALKSDIEKIKEQLDDEMFYFNGVSRCIEDIMEEMGRLERSVETNE